MRQRCWLELIKDYDIEINYHPGKANVVADALSRKSSCNLAMMITNQSDILKDLESLGIMVKRNNPNIQLYTLQIKPILQENIKSRQETDEFLHKMKKVFEAGKPLEFKIHEDGFVWFHNRLCVPDDEEIRKEILIEAHSTPYTIHPGSTKMYRDLKGVFWWNNMKRDIAKIVSECDVCQRIKAEHQRPAEYLQPLEIPVWKCEQISMDFISGLPRTSIGYDSLWVIVDRLTKSAHFILVKQIIH